MVFTQVTHVWQQKCCFLDEIDEEGWDLHLQGREK
jgi:hypothetical protein